MKQNEKPIYLDYDATARRGQRFKPSAAHLYPPLFSNIPLP